MEKRSFLLLSLIALYVVVLIIVLIGNVTFPTMSEHWLGFWGSVVGSLLSAAVAYFIFWLGRRDDRREQDEDREKAHEAAVVAITQPIHCAAIVLRCAIEARDAKILADKLKYENTFDTMMSQLEFACSHFSLREIAPKLEIHIQLIYLVVLGQLNSIIGMQKHRSGLITRNQSMTNAISSLEGLRKYLPLISEELDQQFADDAGL